MIRFLALGMVSLMPSQAVAQADKQEGVSIVQGRPIEITGPYRSVGKALSAARYCGDNSARLIPGLIDRVFTSEDSQGCIRK